MKPAPPDRNIPKLRPLRSLYSQKPATGKSEATPTKLVNRKSMLKPHPYGFKSNRNSTIYGNKTVPRRTLPGIKSTESTRISRVINSAAGKEKCSQFNGIFLRPAIDVRNFHKQMMERNKRLDETLKMNQGESAKNVNLTVVKSTPVPRTPKSSALSRVYLKLTDSKKKLAALKKAPPSSPMSPFEESIVPKKNNMDNCKDMLKVNPEKSLNLGSILHSKLSNNVKGKENDLPDYPISNTNELQTKCLPNVKKEANEDIKHCTFSNILKQCQLYTSSLLNVKKAMDALDEAFERAMLAQVGGDLRAKFYEYQNKKLQLYKKMELLEQELEKWVKSELDVQSKFKEYLDKKRRIMKEHSHLQENFENLVKQMFQNYEKEMGEPAKSEEIEEIMKSLVSGKRECDNENVKPVLRRSKRLASTPRGSDLEGNKRRSGGHKRSKAKDEINLTNKFPDTFNEKHIQSCIYKDLQKSFNLCSPEASF